MADVAGNRIQLNGVSMVRRFVYDPDRDLVVEVGTVRTRIPPREGYDRTLAGYREDRSQAPQLRAAALERADRRVYAHKRFGDERRWTET